MRKFFRVSLAVLFSFPFLALFVVQFFSLPVQAATALTEPQARCYRDRYIDLRLWFDGDNIDPVKEYWSYYKDHWFTYGSVEKRNAMCIDDGCAVATCNTVTCNNGVGVVQGKLDCSSSSFVKFRNNTVPTYAGDTYWINTRLNGYSLADAENYSEYYVSTDKNTYNSGEAIILRSTAKILSSNRTNKERFEMYANFSDSYYPGSNAVGLLTQSGIDLSGANSGSVALIAPKVTAAKTVRIYLNGNLFPWGYGHPLSDSKYYYIWGGKSFIDVTVKPIPRVDNGCAAKTCTTTTCNNGLAVVNGTLNCSTGTATFKNNEASTLPALYLSGHSVSEATNYNQYSVSANKATYNSREPIILKATTTMTTAAGITGGRVWLKANFAETANYGMDSVSLIDAACLSNNSLVGSGILIAPDVTKTKTITINITGWTFPWFYDANNLMNKYLFWPGSGSITVTINPGVLTDNGCASSICSTASCWNGYQYVYGSTVCNNSCAANTCIGSQCWNNLALIDGTKVCNVDNGCAADTCIDAAPCYNSFAWVSGTKPCDNGCAANTCNTTTCNNGVQAVQGTKICTDNSCAANTCIGSQCWNNLALINGTKVCNVDNGCAANTCTFDPPCFNSFAWVTGTKVCDNGCAANTCNTTTCNNGIKTVSGTKICADNSCAALTCKNTPCWNNIEWIPGTKVCADNSCAALTCKNTPCWNNIEWIPGAKVCDNGCAAITCKGQTCDSDNDPFTAPVEGEMNPTFSEYQYQQVIDSNKEAFCQDPLNCGKPTTKAVVCVAKNSCTGALDDLRLNSECQAAGKTEPVPDADTPCDPCKKASNNWTEVTPE